MDIHILECMVRNENVHNFRVNMVLLAGFKLSYLSAQMATV